MCTFSSILQSIRIHLKYYKTTQKGNLRKNSNFFFHFFAFSSFKLWDVLFLNFPFHAAQQGCLSITILHTETWSWERFLAFSGFPLSFKLLDFLVFTVHFVASWIYEFFNNRTENFLDWRQQKYLLHSRKKKRDVLHLLWIYYFWIQEIRAQTWKKFSMNLK